MLRAVVDTNVIISGLLTPGPCREVLAAMRARLFLCDVSPEMFEELEELLSRDKFRHLLNEPECNELLARMDEFISFPDMHNVSICRDPEDDFILEDALGFKSDIIVTGDKDLLALDPFRGIPIVTPAEFIKKFL